MRIQDECHNGCYHRVDEVAHAVRFRPQDLLERVTRHDLVVIRPVPAGRPVHASADLVGQDIDPARTKVLRIEEEKVFEQVGEPGLARGFAGRADVVGNRHCDDRVGAVHVQHDIEPVLKRVFFVVQGERRLIEFRGSATTLDQDDEDDERGEEEAGRERAEAVWWRPVEV